MEFIIIAVAVIIVFILLARLKTTKQVQPKLQIENIPKQLGKLTTTIDPIVEKLESSLDQDYIDKVKQRYLQEHPNKTEADFSWLFFELKRYFILAHIMKKAPMFSEEVDEIWHTMILFTREYEQFSKRFLGEMLHHIPNVTKEPAPQERAFFDWIFSQLFEITQFSWLAWGRFFQHPLSRQLIEDFKTESTDTLREKYFQNRLGNEQVIEYFIEQMQESITNSEKTFQQNKKGDFSKQESFGNLQDIAFMMLFFSYFHFDDYDEYAKDFTDTKVDQYTNGCSSAVFCGSTSNDSSNHGSDSSCSSCGSGCSS